MRFQVVIDLRTGKSRIGPNVQADLSSLIASHERRSPLLPALRTVPMARPPHHPLTVPTRMEAAQGMIAHTGNVAVIGCPFLRSIDRALGTVPVQDHAPMRGMSHGCLPPGGVEMRESVHVLFLGEHLGLESAQGVRAGRLLC
jgi:hypothetical protein